MNKFILSLIVAALLTVIGCSSGDSTTSDVDSSSILILHNQGGTCLDCHGPDSEKEFTSGATVYTHLNSVDSYASGYTVRLVLENTGTIIDYVPKYGTGNSHTSYEESINGFTAKVLDADGNVVNSSANNSHDTSQLNCNSCHTASGVGGAPGRITSDMSLIQEVSVNSVSLDEKVEGASLVHTVLMSGTSATNQRYSFTLGGGTADVATDYDTAVFSNGVINNGDGTITVPSGVASFIVTVVTHDDTLKEGAESFTLNVGGKAAIGTIIDNDTASITAVSSVAKYEGAGLVHTVEMSGASIFNENYTYALGGGTASYPSDYSDAQFSNNILNNGNGTITVPAGVSAFTITVPATDDAEAESTETYNLTVDGVTASGTILDNDTVVTVSVSSVSSDEKVEGVSLVHTVLLSGASATNQDYIFTFGGGTATYTTDYAAAVFSNNVINNENGTITVPAGVTTFMITVPTSDDTLDEELETYNIGVAGVIAVGTITDNDTASVTTVSSASQTEGTSLVHTVQMSFVSTTNKNYTYTLGGGTATYASDYSAAVFSNNVINNENGTITIPAAIITFTITIPTTNDTEVESTETYSLAVGGVSAVGTILDNDTAASTSFASDVMPIFVDADKGNCKSCHTTISNRTFKVGDAAYTYNNIVSNSLINTTSPDSSSILIKGNGGDGHNGGDKLSDANSITVRDWITEGGLNN
ncbi:hypothetical protein HUE87_02400 [Candidatus Sulfurimonas marisnigri]|uniref:Cytochrome c domain-containing protein n=1 Tax=Candidatus Sulfurimonas marisnigri TaxID=2740405 RepID=A0A7S7M0Y5_9BACT|nr:hypothetical protein [Candidatus Sulfurimonas marisnigri]QOY55112.1 hypothetical protein HUE87_02400 [Candidatus Sulfurimonas marisnigri]